jgi:glycerol-3-phosphate O-acyltransferase
VDYIVLSYVLHKSGIQLPVIAAGDNLAFFPAGPVLRRSGAFFIRRQFRGDRLYTAVVDAYLRRLLRDGWILEFFMEGGRSRTGKLLSPKLGLLSMVVASALGLERPVHFVPVAIGYERLMEEHAYARELSGAKKAPEDATQLLRITRLLADRWGRINIQFGDGIELTGLREELNLPDAPSPPERRALVKRVAYQAMSEINRVTALTPGSLVALVLLSYGRRGVAYRDLLAHAGRLTSMLLDLGARATPSLVGPDGRQLRERGIREALNIYVKSGLVEQHVPGDTLTEEGRKRAALYAGTDVIFTVPVSKRIRLDLAKNHIIHWLVERALIAVALLCRPEASAPDGGPALPADTLRRRVRNLSRLFKFEFAFRSHAPFDVLFDELFADMLRRGELVDLGPLVALGPGHDGLDGRSWLTFYATVIRNFLEAYRVAARALGPLVKGPLERKELLARALRTGERMFLEGQIERSEAVNRPLLENAIEAYIDQGYVVRRDERVALSDSFASPEAAQAIEARVAAYLRRRGDDELWG